MALVHIQPPMVIFTKGIGLRVNATALQQVRLHSVISSSVSYSFSLVEYSDGSRYEGLFHLDRKTSGVTSRADGKRFTESWEDGELVSSVPLDGPSNGIRSGYQQFKSECGGIS